MASRRFRSRKSVGNMTTNIDARLRYIEKRPAAKRLQAQVVTTDKLPRAAIVTETIKNLAVVENSIGTNEISTRTIDANAVTNSELNDNAVTNRNITTDAIDARVINANAIIAGKIDVDTITAREIRTNAIIAEKISADAITADKISANAITASLIQGKKIELKDNLNDVARVELTAQGLRAINSAGVNTITFDGSTGRINATDIIVENVNATNVTAGTLTGRTVRTSDPLLGLGRIELDGGSRTLSIYGPSGTRLGLLSASEDPGLGNGFVMSGNVSSYPLLSLLPGGSVFGNSSNFNFVTGVSSRNAVLGRMAILSGMDVSGTVFLTSTLTVGNTATFAGSAIFNAGMRNSNFGGSGNGTVQVNSNGQFFRGPLVAGPTGPVGPPGPPGPPGAKGPAGTPGTPAGGKSDLRLKQKVAPVGLGLNFINKLTPVSFAWNEQADAVQYGLIAQDVEKLMSSEGIENYGLVFRDENELAPEPGLAPSPVRRIDYNQLISPVIKSIQELSLRVDDLEKITNIRKDKK